MGFGVWCLVSGAVVVVVLVLVVVIVLVVVLGIPVLGAWLLVSGGWVSVCGAWFLALDAAWPKTVLQQVPRRAPTGACPTRPDSA